MASLDNIFNAVNFVDKVGEVHTVPAFRHRTIVDLKNFDDREKNKSPSLTDDSGFIPLREQIARLFPTGEIPVIEGYEDVENFDSPDVSDDALDYMESVVDKPDFPSAEDNIVNSGGNLPDNEDIAPTDEKSTGAKANEQPSIASE